MPDPADQKTQIYEHLLRKCEEITRESAIKIEIVSPRGNVSKFSVVQGDAQALARLVTREKQADDHVLIWSEEKERQVDNWDTRLPSDILENIEAHIERVKAHRLAVDQLDLPEGFSLRTDSRDGHIYYREGERILELYIEMSGDKKYDFLVGEDGLSRWILPEEEQLSDAEHARVRRLLLEWFDAQGYAANINP